MSGERSVRKRQDKIIYSKSMAFPVSSHRKRHGFICW